ncbi:MAG: hypothetical protein IJ241_06265 [Clostridia bacterium]|nr:hypothetical protein [Clostridia bacterium]MBQ8926493.1 hypothetical protein [Clostridia bacterium]
MDRRVARTKKNIYYAFFQLVQTKAIDEITVSELARTADIDRKTFYLHYQTVQDVFVEFKQMIHDRLMEILAESERRGRENQAKLDAGEALKRANDIAPFDFVYFYDSLNVIMMDNMAFFEKLSRDTTFMFLKNDFKNVLKQSLLDYYKGWDGWSSDYQASLYSEFVAAGAISLWTDWLHHKQVPLNEFRDSAIEVLREAWKMGTAKDRPYQEIL